MEKEEYHWQNSVTECPLLSEPWASTPARRKSPIWWPRCATLSSFMETGQLEEEIGLNDFIKLYINHRPVLPLNNAQILSAFEAVSRDWVSSHFLSCFALVTVVYNTTLQSF